MPDQFVAGRDAAGPFFCFRVETNLIGRGRVYSGQADFHLTDLNRISVNDARDARDLGRKTGEASKGGWWGKKDSNLRSHKTADLQSAPFATRDTPPLNSIGTHPPKWRQ